MVALVLALAVGVYPTAAPPAPVQMGAPSQPPAATTPAMAAPMVQDPGPSSDPYRIHAADQLAVLVYGDASLSQTVAVMPGGDIYYPLVGRIHVDGQTPDEAAVTIGKVLRKYVKEPIVTVTVVSQGPIDVLVLGDVKNPGKYLLPPTSRVSDALAAAGGLAPIDGDLPVARVETVSGNVQQVSLQKLLHDGDTTIDMRLSNGSSLYVPAPETFSVEVLGSVDRPGEITLHEGDKLAMAIAKAGASPNTNPDLNKIEVKRTLPNGSTKTYTINLYDTLKDGNINNDLTMQKGDIVFVPQARKPTMGSGMFSFLESLLFWIPK